MSALLPCAITLALAACGGGGGGSNVRPSPPPVTPTGPGFTPTVANDSALTQVNPAAISSLPAPISFDTQLGVQMQVINAGASLAAGARGQGIGIGILDSGVRRTHPQLTPRVAYNGFYLDPSTNNQNVDYVLEHGTWVALTAAGSAVGRWPGGVAPAATIVSGRFLSDNPPTDDGSGQGNAVSTADAAGFASFLNEAHADLYTHGARIINNSWGGVYFEDDAAGAAAMAPGYTDFILNKNGLVVFANGNYGNDANFRVDPSDTSSLPTLAPSFGLERGWLTVAALDPDNPTQLLSFSQYCGRSMNYCLSAPGAVYVIGASPVGTTTPNATTEDKAYRVQGTSFAAPLVSGAAAAVWSMFPYFNNDLVRQTILGAAKDVGAPGVDQVFGWGVLDVGKAVNGPANFAWGDVSVSFTGNSTWRNPIIGSGGLIKAGSGILTLTEAASFTGATRVDAGGLDIRKGLASNLSIASGATVWASGAFGGNVTNSGAFFNGAGTPAVIAGNFTQLSTGNLGVWLGSSLKVTGTATLAGQVSILGVKSGYTTAAKETLLNAGAISGTFSSLKAAPNVFLDATLGYDPNNVFLNINRISVTNAVAGMSLSTITNVSAQRVESAMTAIDGQVAGTLPVGIGSAFIDAAGALQQSSSIANADMSLRSLSGELHAASAAMTFDAIDAGRRALNARIDALSHASQATGGWYRDLASSGTLAQGGYDSVGVDASGEMIGNDWRVGSNAVAGIAMNRLEQSSWLSEFGDRSRGRQRELQLYASAWRGDWYGQAQFASGSFQRQMQRNLMLGAMQDAVATQLSGDYLGAFGEIGRRFDAAGIAITPYLGAQYVHVANDGFNEGGATGFGLRADAWSSSRWQSFAGLRAARDWRVGGIDLRADARAEWQQTQALNGELFDASFSGLEQWAPLQGIGLARRSQLFGVGLSAAFGGKATFRFDLSRRASEVGDSNMASLQAMLRF
ncbi:autotransporter serine protease [Thermomonas sp. HDW16]|uniref:autotransporter serine protease n=1 Tax=Thermomonas sp. HDW16 TaxID=2714945 RepID=UPI00140D6491|nr:autotransporter serine protease [Thermomonas sp. HDW16]QIL20855.1 S8 family serine peptidase [Thermomonas sp. HDW16]